MPTPLFNLRLGEKTRADLSDFAKLMRTTPSGLAREILETFVCDDPERVKAFLRRISMVAGEQLSLRMDAVVDDVVATQKPVSKARRMLTSRPRKGRV